MIASDGREIVFAGAGILWGATTFFRGFRVWREGSKQAPARSCAVHSKSIPKSPVPSSLVAGFVLTFGCTAYLAWTLMDLRR